ncbi:MAG: hypothetical protein K0U37_05810 [Gammaproteobacteria bacterium]|nr:hypothetical protein [Gammaproteobacteria bacterium]
MFSLYGWFGGGSTVLEESKIPEEESKVSAPPQKLGATFLGALVQGNVAVYQAEAYQAQVPLITCDTLAYLMHSNSNDAFAWALQQKQFDLSVPVQFKNEPEPVLLLERALQSRNVACVCALIQHDVSSVLSVSPAVLTELSRNAWKALRNNVKKADPSVSAAFEYLHLTRRLINEDAALEEAVSVTGQAACQNTRNATEAQLRVVQATITEAVNDAEMLRSGWVVAGS